MSTRHGEPGVSEPGVSEPGVGDLDRAEHELARDRRRERLLIAKALLALLLVVALALVRHRYFV